MLKPTKCLNDSCPQNKDCVRYNLVNDKFIHDTNYFQLVAGKCVYFIPIRKEQKQETKIETIAKKPEEIVKKTKSFNLDKPLI